MSELDSIPAAAGAAVTPTLGLLLRKAREARGLSIDDVVQALKFSHRQIEAVEADDLSALPGNVFARGLIRSYARFLKLDPAPLLGLVQASAPVITPDVRPPDNMGSAMPRGVRQIPPLLAVSVLLLIAIATMVGWHFVGTADTPVPSATEASNETTTPAAQHAVEPVPPPQTAVDSSAAPQEAPVAVTAPATEVPAASVQPIPTPMPAEGRRLSFDFRGDSWIEVKDYSGQIVLTGLFGVGKQSASGRPPFDVVIGNAARVDMQYEGRAIDLRPHTRAEVARLTVQ